MITAGELFLNDYNPMICVNDINNLIKLKLMFLLKQIQDMLRK